MVNIEEVIISLEEFYVVVKRINIINSTFDKPFKLFLECWVDLEELCSNDFSVLIDINHCGMMRYLVGIHEYCLNL